jgi:serine/threonine protein kinase
MNQIKQTNHTYSIFSKFDNKNVYLGIFDGKQAVFKYTNSSTEYKSLIKLQNNPKFKTPTVYYHTTDQNDIVNPLHENSIQNDQVIVMEYIKAVNLYEWMEKFHLSKTKYKLCLRLIEIFTQIQECGVFHYDPHPTNILVLPKNDIALIDFGLSVELTSCWADPIREATYVLLYVKDIIKIPLSRQKRWQNNKMGLSEVLTDLRQSNKIIIDLITNDELSK